MANKLERITTEYISAEDRIRLAGVTDDELLVVLWLTQRLLNRLLPPLFEWLTQHEDSFSEIETLHFVAQQQSTPQMSQQPLGQGKKNRQMNTPPLVNAEKDSPKNLQTPVPVEKDGPSLLITSIDLSSNNSIVNLNFKSGSAEPLSLIMTAPLLSQWLSILFFTYHKADWPLTGWPDWMVESHRKEEQPVTVTIH